MKKSPYLSLLTGCAALISSSLPLSFSASVQAAQGWVHSGSSWYYELNGVKASGWKKISQKWYCFDPSSKKMQNKGWRQIFDSWYYFNAGGSMKTGWLQEKGAWYFLSNSGAAMQGQWMKSGLKWYYFDQSAMMATGFRQIGNDLYFFDNNGEMAAGRWIVDGASYLFDENGRLVQESEETNPVKPETPEQESVLNKYTGAVKPKPVKPADSQPVQSVPIISKPSDTPNPGNPTPPSSGTAITNAGSVLLPAQGSSNPPASINPVGPDPYQGPVQNSSVQRVLSAYEKSYRAFIQDPRFQNGAWWGDDKTPYLAANKLHTGCSSYAADFVAYVFHQEFDWQKDDYHDASQIRSGDIIRSEGHTIIVLERNGNSLYTAESNISINGSAGMVRIANNTYSIQDGHLYEIRKNRYRTINWASHWQ